MGESGMLVVGGDSGGTRLNDVRFVYKYKYKYKYVKYKNTACCGGQMILATSASFGFDCNMS